MGSMSQDEIATTLIAVAAIAVAALIWWMTREAAAGRIKRNRFSGIRTRRTLASDENWVRGHQIALPYTFAARYAAGAVAVGALVAVGLERAVPLGLALAVGAVVVVLATSLAAVLTINRELDLPG